MTESTTETTTVDNTADVTDQGRADLPTTAEPEPTPNSEAARRRVQLRDAETKIATQAETITRYQRRECEAVVADLLDVPGDLWEVAQADVAAFYNDDGTINEAELRAAAGALIETRPRLARPQREHPQWGQHSGPAAPTSQEAGWGDVIGR